jgi:hypothetical protein
MWHFEDEFVCFSNGRLKSCAIGRLRRISV